MKSFEEGIMILDKLSVEVDLSASEAKKVVNDKMDEFIKSIQERRQSLINQINQLQQNCQNTIEKEISSIEEKIYSFNQSNEIMKSSIQSTDPISIIESAQQVIQQYSTKSKEESISSISIHSDIKASINSLPIESIGTISSIEKRIPLIGNQIPQISQIDYSKIGRDIKVIGSKGSGDGQFNSAANKSRVNPN